MHTVGGVEMTVEAGNKTLVGLPGGRWKNRLLLRPHGRSEGRVFRGGFRDAKGWYGRYSQIWYLNRAQAAQAVWEERRDDVS